jgi:hypothetical protein
MYQQQNGMFLHLSGITPYLLLLRLHIDCHQRLATAGPHQQARPHPLLSIYHLRLRATEVDGLMSCHTLADVLSHAVSRLLLLLLLAQGTLLQ